MKTLLGPRSVPLLAALAVLALTGCGPSADASKPVSLSANDSGRTVHMRVGDELVVTLDSNASTGFRWVQQGEPDPGVLELVSSEYEAPTTSLLGAGGREVWRYRATGPGSANLELSYERSSGEVGAEPFRISVEVAD